MIEVEKSFNPTEEQLKEILNGAEFLGEVVNHDIYYDYPDLRLAKQKIKLRFRNGTPELKIEKSELIEEEIESLKEIKKYFKIDGDLSDFVSSTLIEIINYKNTRKKYRKDGINIDVDSLDFGFKCCDFEIMVKDESEILKAQEKIYSFACKYGLDPNQKNIGKRRAYLKKFNIEMYNKIYGKE